MLTTQKNNAQWQFLDATTIKFLAAALMFIDHIHQMFYSMGVPSWVDLFGRPVFPLFLFLAADSFHYTHSKKGYIKRLLLASWAMTLLTFVTQRLFPNDTVALMNNAFSTFFAASLYMLGWDFLQEGLHRKDKKKIRNAVLVMLIPVVFILPTALMLFLAMTGMASAGMIQVLSLVSLLLPNLITAEGGPLYVLLGFLFYIFRENRRIQILAVLAFGVIAYLLSGGVQWAILLAAVPMLLYNGQKGKGAKNFFYIFYPAHIIALYLLATFLMKL